MAVRLDPTRVLPPMGTTTDRSSFVERPTEEKFRTMVSDLRAWKRRGRKTWVEARRFLVNLRVLASELNLTLDQAIDAIETAAELDG